MNAPRIFRVTGTGPTMDSLYNHFDTSFSGAGSPSKVEETVGPSSLPDQPKRTLDDLASVFKRIIYRLPGGLFGSVELFEVLRGILLDWHSDSESSTSDVENSKAELVAADSKSSTSDVDSSKAELVALTLSSISSIHRSDLIQAVIGFLAYFGYEADKAKAAEKAAATRGLSEIMGSKALCTCFAPLLLGEEKIHGVNVSKGNSKPTLQAGNTAELDQEPIKTPKKQKTVFFQDDKPETDARVSADADQRKLGAKLILAAELLNALLMNWKAIVLQLRNLHDLNSQSIYRLGDNHHGRGTSNQAGSRLTMLNSEEDSQFLDVMRGGPLPPEIRHPVQMKYENGTRTRSPLTQVAAQMPQDSKEIPGYTDKQDGTTIASDKATHSTTGRRLWSASSAPSLEEENCEGPDTVQNSEVSRGRHTKSDLAMDRMAMSTILTPGRGPCTSVVRMKELHATPIHRTPSPCSPETTRRVVPIPAGRQADFHGGGVHLRKRHPPITHDSQIEECIRLQKEDANEELHKRITSSCRSSSRMPSEGSESLIRRSTSRVPSSSSGSGKSIPPPVSKLNNEAIFPLRQSSLRPDHLDMPAKLEPLPAFRDVAEHTAYFEANSNPPVVLPPLNKRYGVIYNSPVKRSTSRKASEVPKDEIQMFAGFDRNSSGSVKKLTQKFAESSITTQTHDHVSRTGRARDNTTTQAHGRSILPGQSGEKLVVSAANPSPPRETMIPKPVNNVGRGRIAESSRSPTRTPSPPKQTSSLSPQRYPQSRPSVYSVMCQPDASSANDRIRANATKGLQIQSQLTTTAGQVDPLQNGPPAPAARLRRPSEYNSLIRSQYSTDNFRLRNTGNKSIDPNGISLPFTGLGVPETFPPRSLRRVDSYEAAIDALQRVRRHGSVNSTLMAQIMDTQSQLADKLGDILTEQQRFGFGPGIMATRGHIVSHTGLGYSWQNDTVDTPLQKVRKGVRYWKKKAQIVESELMGETSNDHGASAHN